VGERLVRSCPRYLGRLIRGLATAIAFVIAWLGVILALVLPGKRAVAREVAALIPNLLALIRGCFGDRMHA
jgi:hypothetical protein